MKVESTASSGSLPPTPRTTPSRHADRARYDRQGIHLILDQGLICHVGFVVDGQPYVIPTSYVRIEERLYIHGSALSRMIGQVGSGASVCVTVTHLDGLVLARSAMHHSANYRSVVVLARPKVVTDPEEKRTVLHALVDHLIPGRNAEVRPPTDAELAATGVIEIPIEEASAKVRTGDPVDAASDRDSSVWAGVLPLEWQMPAPESAADNDPGLAPPPSVDRFRVPAER